MQETEQMRFWKGDFGDSYTDRNAGEWDEFYKATWGITRTELIKCFLSELHKDSSILEIGCNRGNQLLLLKVNGYTNLWGIEINKKSLELAKEDRSLNLVEGYAQDIPFKDNFFDMVFTSGVLIHISPSDLHKAIDEIYRVSKKYIWCFEYFSEQCEEIDYRGYKNRLWKNNFLKLFMDRHTNLKLVKKEKIKYLHNENVDMMFLLEKQ